MGLLDGRAAVVTGGGRGIGLSIARTLLAQGAGVVLGDLDGDAATAAAAGLVAEGGRAVGVACDVTSEDDMAALTARAVSEYGSLDVMVNNAGITRDATMRKLSVEDFRAVLDVHVVGGWLGTRAAAAVMREQGSGSIVNISSISGKVGNAGQTNYSAAKAALVGMSKAAAKEVAYKGVRVNVVQPGLVRTAMTEKMPPAIFEQRVADIPMGRAGEPEDIADVVLFLASDLSRYMTGTVLEVTGGRWM